MKLEDKLVFVFHILLTFTCILGVKYATDWKVVSYAFMLTILIMLWGYRYR